MNKILVPTDFSDTAENAINYAVNMANFFSANLILLHVNQIPVSTPEFGIAVYNFSEIKKDSLDSLNKKALEIKKDYPQISEIECFSEIGDSSDFIAEFSKEHNIDMVVMGNSGHGSKFKKNIFGSTSVAVAKKIEVPLMIVSPEVKYKKITNMAYACVYDEQIETSTSLMKVRSLSKEFNSLLSVLHVIPENHLINEKEANIDVYVENKLATTEHRTFILTENNVSMGILDFVKNHDVDLIVVEPQKHSLFHSLFNSSVTNELAFFSPVPVLTIHG
jgi:nucleotide-binding universal stress UspA family protein